MNVIAGCNLTPRDEDLLDTLTRRVRVLTLSQIARTWYATTTTPLTARQPATAQA